MLYRALFDTVLRRVPPETAHAMSARSLRIAAANRHARAGLRRCSFPAREALRVDALGLSFPSPLGVAAGLDKNAETFDGLGSLGFGFVEVGTVTPRPQPGNPTPRVARVLADRALVNRMGFPNCGAEVAGARLALRSGETIVGANLGKNLDTPVAQAAEDYRAVAAALAPHADYLVINVSSPNTPGLRALESTAALAPLLVAVQDQLAGLASPPPLLVKISPDLADAAVDAVAELALSAGLAGVVATNTTVARSVLSPAGASSISAFEGGGVSGPPLAARSLEVLTRLYTALRGSEAIVISVGGVSTAEDVWQRIHAGATLVQAYTGFVYGGPAWPGAVNRELARRVRGAGVSSIQELIGSGSGSPAPAGAASPPPAPAPPTAA